MTILFITVSLLGVAAAARAVTLSHRLDRFEREASSLERLARAVGRSERTLPLSRFSFAPLRSLSAALLSISSKLSPSAEGTALTQLPVWKRALAAGLFRQAKEKSCLPGLVVDLCAPDILACALLKKNRQSGCCEFAGGAGAGIDRLKEILLTTGEFLPESSGTTGSATLIRSRPNDVFDLSVFGIGESLVIPLRGCEKTAYLLWVGLSAHGSLTGRSKTGNALSEETLEQISALAALADEVHEHTAATEAEKKQLQIISHDIKAPGLSALFALRMLLAEAKGTLSSEHEERLLLIERALEEQLDLLGDFLDYSKHERGALTASRQPLALDTALEEVVERTRSQLDTGGPVRFVSTVPSLSVHADPVHLRRIAGNLLSNAFKFTRKGEVRLESRLRGSYVEITVSDTGIGVPHGEERNLFRDFSRLGNAGAAPGYGLGLSVAKVLAELNDGYLKFERRSDGGAAFVLGLEAATASRPECRGPHRELRSALIVDDDPFAAQAVVRLLKESACAVTVVSNLHDARKQLCHRSPDLIVIDSLLPDGKGSELLAEQTENAEEPPCVLMLSGSDDVPEIPELQNVRASRKPISRAAFQELLGEMFGQR